MTSKPNLTQKLEPDYLNLFQSIPMLTLTVAMALKTTRTKAGLSWEEIEFGLGRPFGIEMRYPIRIISTTATWRRWGQRNLSNDFRFSLSDIKYRHSRRLAFVFLLESSSLSQWLLH